MRTTLVSTAELAAHPEWRVFDCRHDLLDPSVGRALYEQGHIPGALHAHLDEDLAAPRTGRNGRHPLPEPGAFAAWLGAQGLRHDDQVVVYDADTGAFAARLWWMLRWVGHRAVAVLDGGFAAWVAEGRPVSTERPRFAQTKYTVRPDSRMYVSAADVEANLRTPTFQLLDARAANRYEGRDETIDPVAGHIPGALNRPFTSNLDASGRFKSPEVLRAEFAALLGGTEPSRVVHQCGSGVTSCHNLLAMEHAQLPGSRLYPGSWSEWCSDASRPIATGPS